MLHYDILLVFAITCSIISTASLNNLSMSELRSCECLLVLITFVIRSLKYCKRFSFSKVKMSRYLKKVPFCYEWQHDDTPKQSFLSLLHFMFGLIERKNLLIIVFIKKYTIVTFIQTLKKNSVRFASFLSKSSLIKSFCSVILFIRLGERIFEPFKFQISI